MRSLAVYLKDYKIESILAPFFKFLEVVFDLIVPIIIAQIIDVGIANHNNGYIVQRFFLLILMAAFGLTCSFTAQFFAAKASVGFATKLRQAVYDHVQHLSFTELDTLGTDTLITRLTDDINQVQNGLNMGLRLLLRSPFIVLGSMVMAFTIDFKCALVFAVAIPFLFLVVFVIMFLSIPLFKKVQEKLDTVTGLTRQNLTGVRVIRAFCREKEAVQEFDTRNDELTKLNLFVGRLSALLNPVTYVLINIATVILIQKAGVEVNLGSMHQGQVVALYNYMAQMIVELIKLASLIITLNKSAACAGRVADILKVKSTMDYPAATAVSAASSDDAVVFDDVTFEYSGAGAPSLSHISFSVKKGQTVGIIGGTGSGKTTFLAALSEYIPRDERIITIEDNAELRIRGIDNLVRLEAKMANMAGAASVTIRDLIRSALRMRPDRIIVGEVRGGEAMDMLQALNTGHEGSLSTAHANSSRDMLSRLETMVLMGVDLPLEAIRRQIASGVDILVHLGRMRDRSRKLLEVTEVCGFEKGEIQTRPLYQWQEGKGLVKTADLLHMEKLERAGIEL